MTLEALIFSGIGSLVECAEHDRGAWNAAFRMHDVPWDWSVDTYAELLHHGGERRLAARYAAHMDVIVDAEALDASHQKLFAARLSGPVPLRPGVARVMNWAARGGVKLALVSRSDPIAAHAVFRATARERGGVAFDVAILRPDMSFLPPDPDGIHTAIDALGVGAGRSVVVADSTLGAQAAIAAGVPVVMFPGQLARREPETLTGFDPVHVLSPERLTSAWNDISRTAAE